MKIKSEVQNLTWPLWAVSPQSSYPAALHPVSLSVRCGYAENIQYRYKCNLQSLAHGGGCDMFIKPECVLWPANYEPEIFPLECSSGLLLLKPKPPPLCGLLEDPVFVSPEVMGPRCKLLYLWRQSLFLGRNLILLERGRTCCLQGNTLLPLNRTMDLICRSISSGLS